MTTKTYAFKSDAKKAAIRSGALADDINLYQTTEGRWTWTLHSEHEAVWESQHPAAEEKPAKKTRTSKKSPAKTTTKTATVKESAKADRVRFSARVLEKLGKRASKVDINKNLVKELLGEMDDRKARRIARQVVRSLNA